MMPSKPMPMSCLTDRELCVHSDHDTGNCPPPCVLGGIERQQKMSSCKGASDAGHFIACA